MCLIPARRAGVPKIPGDPSHSRTLRIPGKETQAAWGSFLFANLALPVVAAFVVSIIYTVLARSYRPLLGLCVLHILFLAAIVLVMSSQSAEGASEIPVDVAILSYGAFFIAVSVWWFAVGRRRMIEAKS